MQSFMALAAASAATLALFCGCHDNNSTARNKTDAIIDSENEAQLAAAKIPADNSATDKTKLLAIHQIPAQTSNRLKVWSSAFKEDGVIPDSYSDYGGKISPEVFWSLPPAGTKSMAFLVEDPDAPKPTPMVHWVVYNVQPGVLTLQRGIAATEHVASLRFAMQGKNSNGEIGYYGPHPAMGDSPHHYHFEAFALDTMLHLQPGADRDQLVQAMQGHVISEGETIGLYQK